MYNTFKGWIMDKIQFNKLEILKQLEYVNLNLKQGQTLTAIAKIIGISKTTIRDRVSKIGYQYNATNKLYEKVNSEGIQIDHKVIKTQQEEPKEVKNHIRGVTKKVIAEPINVKGNVSNSGNIIINKTVNTVKAKRIAYYLLPSTIKDIETLAKQCNMGISEFLQKFLSVALDMIKIE